MAQSNRIETRIGLRGGDDVRKQLEDIGRAGEKAFTDIGKRAADVKIPTAGDEIRQHFNQLGQAAQSAGNQVRASLVAATQGLGGFSTGAAGATASAGQMRAGLVNLAQQTQDVVVSLQAGQRPLSVLLQQGSQIGTVFATTPGILGAVGSAVRGMITPWTLAATAIAATAAGLALVVARAASTQAAAREFDVLLRGIGKSGVITGAELATAARGLRDVGLTFDDAKNALAAALREGIRPTEAARIVRIGQDLNAVLGEGSLEKFIQAAAKGGEPLREFAERLGIIPRGAAAAEAALRNVRDATSGVTQSIVDEQRRAAQQIADLTRRKGTDLQEIERASQQRIADLLRQRNQENAKRLAEFNKQIEDAAQKAAGASLVAQIEQRVKGAAENALSPFERATRRLALAWNSFLDAMANSAVAQSALSLLQSGVTALGAIFETLAARVRDSNISAFSVAIAAAVPIVATLVGVVSKLGFVIGPVATGLGAIAAAVGWPVTLLAGVLAVTAAFVDWKAVLDGTTWNQFTGTLQAMLNMFKALGSYIADQFVQLIVAAFQLVQDAFTNVALWIGDRINEILGFFQTLINAANAVANAIRNAFAAANAPVTGPVATAPIPERARGGLIRGPGTSLSDSILARLSDGEFVLRARAVEHWGLGVLESLNQLRNPFQGFALGGLAGAMSSPLVSRPGGSLARTLPASPFAAAPTGSPVFIQFGGGNRVGPMMADRDVVQSLKREALKSQTLSMGRRPSSVG